MLRKKLLNLLRKQKEEDRLKKSRVICRKLLNTPEYQDAKVILFYASFDGEVNTEEMIKQAQDEGKKVALPRILRDKRTMIPTTLENTPEALEDGPYGIKQHQPQGRKNVALRDIDLVIVPGVAFDRHKNRLGRGAGYYDRFLKKLPLGIPTVGLAFDFQVLNRLSQTESHDVSVSHLISN